ncbi:hypothetical protein QYE76_012527 [Lolium multiflorum]|uniref:Uncharacterized protein n=1 Tax=Lolium multiflorum TaxID=4521 RepID=A0AAD8TXA9_LOLMU|nr:hypothetical protein QYE76_012527 [Lolium multiflorum]
MDIFAWQPSDMSGVPRELAEHYLNINPGAKPVKQAMRRFGDKKRRAIGMELAKLLEAGATYQRTMQRCLKDQIGRNVHAYVDDIAVMTRKGSDLLSDLKETFDNLRRYKMMLNPLKCVFGVPAGKLLGFIVSHRGIEVNPEKIKAILNIKRPTCLKDVQRLTGCVAAISRFVSRLGEKALPLYKLLKKTDKFVWDEAADEALQELKNILSSPPILAAPAESEPMLLYMAATNKVISLVIVVVRKEEGYEHGVQRPVYYISEVLTESKQRYPHFQKLAYGVFLGSRKLRHYFQEHPMTVVSKAPLATIINNSDATGRVAKWGIELSAFDINYEARTAIKSQVLADFIADWTEAPEGTLIRLQHATIAKSRQIENTETPNENVATPVNSPESVEYSSDDLDEDYVELDDDFIEKCNATTDARKIKNLLAEHAVRYKPSPDPKFATSPINIRDKDYDFSLDLSHIAIVEKTPFCGTEKESAVEHMTELSTLSGLFSDDIKMRTYFVAKIFPFSLKDDAKTWYNNLPPGSIKSPKELLDVFFRKYFPASAQHAALQRIYNFDQEDGEKLPEAWARFCSLIRAQPDHDLEKHDLLDIFYSGLTIESRAYLDSCAGCVFRKRTPDDAEELLAKIGRNHDDWSTPEPTPTPIVKKRGMIKLNDEDMREAKKSLKEKGIKPEDVKNLPPIEDICETIPPSSMIEDPLYPEGHPKRVEQDSQLIKTSAPSKKKKKKHKNVVESSEPVNDPNSISISDAETKSGNEHEEDNDKNDTPDKEEIEKEPEKPAKNKKYTKEDFITEKHGAVIDCNKGMVTFNVDDKEHTVYFPKRIDKDFEFHRSRTDPMVRNGWSITENELNAYIERESRRAREDVEEAEEHPDSSSDAASSSYQHHGHVEPPRYSSAQGPYYHSMYDPPAWNSDPRWE